MVNGVTEAIGSGEFSAGQYNQVRLIIGNSPELENNLLRLPHPEANYLILNDGANTIEPLKIPSGFQTGIKLVHPFTVGEGEIKELVLDFDASRSVVKAGNSGKYILKPTIKVHEEEDKIDIGGTVTDDAGKPAPLAGVKVSAQISDGLSATVVRTTISSDNEGKYLLTLLSPRQTYNIVAYSQGKYPACTAFMYDADNALLPLDFTLSTAHTAAVSGKVSVEGAIPEDFPLFVTIYTVLDCNHPENENYVELTKVRADDVTHQTVALMHNTFVTPFDRDQINKLIQRMDDILDLMQDTAESLKLYDVHTLTPEVSHLADLVQICCQRVATAVTQLSSRDNSPVILKICQEIDALETDADRVMQAAISRLFREEQNVRQLVKLKAIYELLELTTDKCQDVALVIEGVVLENG